MTAVERAIAEAERRPIPRSTAGSHFLLEVERRGIRRHVGAGGWRHNLTTDTASGYTNRRDWQAKAMGGGPAPTATMVGNATATSSTSLTNSGASFPTSSQGLAGCIVAAGPNSAGTGSTVFGVITSNTSTALTVDRWYNPGTLSAGTTPNSTCSYQVLPGQAPASWLALSTDAVAPAASDTTLASEISTNGLARAIGVWAHTAAASTYTLTNIFTCSGGDNTINKEAVFGAASGGVMPFESAEPSPPRLTNGDTVTQTVSITIG